MILSEEKLRDLLVAPGHISEEVFDAAKEGASKHKTPLDYYLVEEGFVKDENLGKVVADALKYPFVSLKKENIDEISDRLLSYIPEAVARSQQAIVIGEEGDALKLATAHPDNYEFIKQLEKKTGKNISVYYSTPHAISAALRKYRGDLQGQARSLISEIQKNPNQGEKMVVRLVDIFLENAVVNYASDVHIEPLSESVSVRFRIDGTLFKVFEYPKDLHDRVVSRIKILSRLRTDEQAAPQDGRFGFSLENGQDVDIRVSTIPITEGENVVMRILMQQGDRKFTLDDLGFSDQDLRKIKMNAKKPWGMILVGGPTGSGKTTTLYGILQLLNTTDVNIMTIEDPVEYNMEGVQQSQVNAKKNLTFPTGLRAIVRQDPDIIMVGEIRDEETAAMAVDSAMTGHLVLSTMHANDSATTFPRLLDMGVESFLISSSINISIAQRLVHKVCEGCRASYFMSAEEVDQLMDDVHFVESIKEMTGKDDLTKVRFFKGNGCDLCEHTGYLGRIAIFEILEVSEALRKLIAEKASSDTIRKKAIEEGMSSMMDDGISKALMGITTIEEVRKAAKS